jgi:hypothetical protein
MQRSEGAGIQFRRKRQADDRIASAVSAMRAILNADGVLPVHKRELLSLCLWKITEAEGGKYGTRFRSRAALTAARAELAHEHVEERARLANHLLEHPDRVEDVVTRAIACVVTREEHRQLSALSRARPDLDGWARYEAAGIEVIDLAAGAGPPAS